MFNYLKDQEQAVQINNNFSSHRKVGAVTCFARLY